MGCKFCKTVPELAVAKGDIISYDSGGVPVKLVVGADGKVLEAASGETSGLKWGDKTVATKEFFVPNGFTFGANNGYTVEIGGYAAGSRSSSEKVAFSFMIPADFSSLTEAVVVIIPDTTETVQWDVSVAVAAVGEDYNNDVTTGINKTKAVTINDLTELDISTEMANAAASDYVGVDFQSDTDVIRVLGIRIKYT